jgi:hypothetical protein
MIEAFEQPTQPVPFAFAQRLILRFRLVILTIGGQGGDQRMVSRLESIDDFLVRYV